jgi:hypothetical protein
LTVADEEIDTTNLFMVALMGDKLLIANPPRSPITEAEALNLAAYLVAMAETEGGQFQKVLEAVQGA